LTFDAAPTTAGDLDATREAATIMAAHATFDIEPRVVADLGAAICSPRATSTVETTITSPFAITLTPTSTSTRDPGRRVTDVTNLIW
jgi:hypothetical protein